MTNAEIITALRCCASLDTPCKGLCSYHGVEYCLSKKDLDAADALEAAERLLDQNTKRCEALRKQLRESHENYEKHLNELEAQMPKEGEWIPINWVEDAHMFKCSVCGEVSCCNASFCNNCGAKMRGEHDE